LMEQMMISTIQYILHNQLHWWLFLVASEF
jgi:hypothetical protein